MSACARAPFGTAGAIVLLGLAAPAPSLAAQSSDRAARAFALEVMTFNIRTAIGRDGDNAWPHRKELVLETIRRSEPDVVGLQEALAEQIAFLDDRMPEYRWLGADRGLNGGTGLSEATPIFYRADKLVPIESGTFWLGDSPDPPTGRRRVSRIVTWARFHHVETRRAVYVYNTHFTLRRGPRQHASAARINERISALPPESAVVVLGDFNAVAEAEGTWEVATAGGLVDAWVVAERRLGPALTAAGFGPPPRGREGRIDWVLVGGPVVVTEVETVVHSRDGRYPSDHYPVRASLRIGPR